MNDSNKNSGTVTNSDSSLKTISSLLERIQSLENLSENYNKLFLEINDNISKIKKQGNDLSDGFKKEIKETKDKFDEKINNSNAQSLSILAIFTTIFTFLSLNVNIFKNVQDAKEAVFFMSVIAFLCLVIIFVSLFVLFLFNGKEFQYKEKLGKTSLYIFVLTILVFLLLYFFSCFFNFKINLVDENENNQKIEIKNTQELLNRS